MHYTEHTVTVIHRFGHDAHPEDVGKFLETEFLFLHLAINAVDVFLPVFDHGVDIRLFEALAEEGIPPTQQQ